MPVISNHGTPGLRPIPYFWLGKDAEQFSRLTPEFVNHVFRQMYGVEADGFVTVHPQLNQS